MKKVKKFIGTMLASAFILSAMVMSVSAYWDPTGNREVLYYNFSIQQVRDTLAPHITVVTV